MMTTLRSAAVQATDGMNLARLDDFLAFIADRLSPDDREEAESLLHAALSPAHAARRHEKAARRAAEQRTQPAEGDHET